MNLISKISNISNKVTKIGLIVLAFVTAFEVLSKELEKINKEKPQENE